MDPTINKLLRDIQVVDGAKYTDVPVGEAVSASPLPNWLGPDAELSYDELVLREPVLMACVRAGVSEHGTIIALARMCVSLRGTIVRSLERNAHTKLVVRP